MSALPFGETVQYGQRPWLELAYAEGGESRKLFSEYYDVRTVVADLEKPQGEELTAIQESVRGWIEQSGFLDLPEDEADRIAMYTDYDKNTATSKLVGLADFLWLHHGQQVSEEELIATELFVHSAFAMYEDQPAEGREVMDDADGKFAFVVPARMSRSNSEYGEEVEPVIPALRYVPNELRSQMLLGLPPFVIDTYAADEAGRRGYLILAPVYEDINQDVSSSSARLNTSQRIVNDAVNYAHRRHGVEVVGLGATLPAVTRYGQKITNPNVITTTGHGGTAELITRTMENGLAAKGEQLESIGMLGLGTIGASVTEIIAARYPNTPVRIYDVAAAKSDRLDRTHPNRFIVADSDVALVNDSQVIISAIVGRFDTTKVPDMESKLVVDDAQPGSFDPEAVRELGGHVLWVIGSNPAGNVAYRTGYDYGTMENAHTDLFGCEAEAAVLAEYIDDLKSRGMGDALSRIIAEKVAIRSAVDVRKVRLFGALFKKFGIVAANPQAFGKPVSFDKPQA